MRFLVVFAAVAAFFLPAGILWYVAGPTTPDQRGVETIYVVNHASQYISDSQIKHDIPSWESAANNEFASAWRTPQVKIVLTKVVPRGGIEALFVKNGPVQGALAFHTVTRGVPRIVVYAGVGDFYGYSNSVSFTHELFEMLADPTITVTQQGYPYPNVCLSGSNQCAPQPAGTIWASEVCDPVEDYDYQIDGVRISDFITPNWFNDEIAGPIDYMGYLSSPYLIAPGGYAQFWDGSQWHAIFNFRNAGRDASGFYKGERLDALH